jgi:hypothetical protein
VVLGLPTEKSASVTWAVFLTEPIFHVAVWHGHAYLLKVYFHQSGYSVTHSDLSDCFLTHKKRRGKSIMGFCSSVNTIAHCEGCDTFSLLYDRL